jgi:hypothetical protein
MFISKAEDTVNLSNLINSVAESNPRWEEFRKLAEFALARILNGG